MVAVLLDSVLVVNTGDEALVRAMSGGRDLALMMPRDLASMMRLLDYDRSCRARGVPMRLASSRSWTKNGQ